MPVEFSAARAKIKRARKHISELEQVVSAHMADHPITYTNFTKDPATGVASFKFTTPPLPEDVSVILGDIIHNARSALDLMASALAYANGKSRNGVYFPFSHAEKDLDEMIHRKKFNRCGASAVALLKSFEPYHGGNLELRAIRDLDVLEKHQALIPDPKIDASISFNMETGAVGPIPYSWRFPPETSLKKREIISTTKALVELCESILEAFAALETCDQGR